jgi:phospholipid/cholesterol/gamma-HCH transport system permease protein
MDGEPQLRTTSRDERVELVATGAWTAAYAGSIEQLVTGVARDVPTGRGVAIDMKGIRQLDTLGAWLIERLTRQFGSRGQAASLVGVPDNYRGLFDKVHQVNRRARPVQRKEGFIWDTLDRVGRATADLRYDLLTFLDMLGALGLSLLRMIAQPRQFRLTSTVHHLYRVGWRAIPIMLLITFLIGGIIAQQGFFHFRKFGADSYVVDMVGILVLREIGVLLVAIMVAGRSGSAYTAELGSMKMREEIDALRTMGFDPVDVLILPRVLALVCALPILTFFGAMAALYGGGLVAWLYGDMSPAIFIARLREAISVTHFEVGMIKAPFMALAIGIVSCSEGLLVQGSAESLGTQTTTSVVKSIFLVIVLDGLFAMFFASIGM